MLADRFDSVFDDVVARLTDRTLTLAESCSDATKAAALLVEAADRQPSTDRFSALAGVRWRLAGTLDSDPGDLVALAALGLTALAALEPD